MSLTGPPWREYPCGDLLTTAQSTLTYSVSGDSYSISAANGFTREVDKDSLPFPREELLPQLAAGDYYAFSVEDGALTCTIGLRATETDYAGYLTVTLALEDGGFRPAGYAWAPAQAVTEHLLPPLDDSLDIAVPDFLTQEHRSSTATPTTCTTTSSARTPPWWITGMSPTPTALSPRKTWCSRPAPAITPWAGTPAGGL